MLLFVRIEFSMNILGTKAPIWTKQVIQRLWYQFIYVQNPQNCLEVEKKLKPGLDRKYLD